MESVSGMSCGISQGGSCGLGTGHNKSRAREVPSRGTATWVPSRDTATEYSHRVLSQGTLPQDTVTGYRHRVLS